jgi:lipopolysaccharide export system protein LptA
MRPKQKYRRSPNNPDFDGEADPITVKGGDPQGPRHGESGLLRKIAGYIRGVSGVLTKRTALFGLVAALFLIAAPYSVSWAAGGVESVEMTLKQSNSRVEVTSAKLLVKRVGSDYEITFVGPVKIKQDDLTLTCDRLVTVYEDEKKNKNDRDGKTKTKDAADSVKSAVATGNVKITKGSIRAEAGKAVLDNVKRTVTLSEGPPKIWQGPHMMTAPTIIVYLDEERAEFLGGIKVDVTPTQPGKKKED